MPYLQPGAIASFLDCFVVVTWGKDEFGLLRSAAFQPVSAAPSHGHRRKKGKSSMGFYLPRISKSITMSHLLASFGSHGTWCWALGGLAPSHGWVQSAPYHPPPCIIHFSCRLFARGIDGRVAMNCCKHTRPQISASCDPRPLFFPLSSGIRTVARFPEAQKTLACCASPSWSVVHNERTSGLGKEPITCPVE